MSNDEAAAGKSREDSDLAALIARLMPDAFGSTAIESAIEYEHKFPDEFSPREVRLYTEVAGIIRSRLPAAAGKSRKDGIEECAKWHDEQFNKCAARAKEYLDRGDIISNGHQADEAQFHMHCAVSLRMLCSRLQPAAASEATVREAVNPLCWEEVREARSEFDPSTEVVGWEAPTAFGTFYLVEHYFGSDSFGFAVKHDHESVGDYDDPDAAKAAAQADHDKRILSALSARSAGEAPISAAASPLPAAAASRSREVMPDDMEMLIDRLEKHWPEVVAGDELISAICGRCIPSRLQPAAAGEAPDKIDFGPPTYDDLLDALAQCREAIPDNPDDDVERASAIACPLLVPDLVRKFVAGAGEAPISAEAVNTSTTIPIVVRDLQTIASVLRNMQGDGSASQHFGKRVDEAASVIQSLAGALEPFADLADEIEAMAKQDGSDPENWAKACTWHDLIAARSALSSLREGA